MADVAFARPATNLMSKLLDEIERVVALRERYRAVTVPGTAGMSFYPVVAVMTLAINDAKRSIAEDDVVASLRALHDLEGFTDG